MRKVDKETEKENEKGYRKKQRKERSVKFNEEIRQYEYLVETVCVHVHIVTSV